MITGTVQFNEARVRLLVKGGRGRQQVLEAILITKAGKLDSDQN